MKNNKTFNENFLFMKKQKGTKACFFEKIIKIAESIHRLIGKKEKGPGNQNYN